MKSNIILGGLMLITPCAYGLINWGNSELMLTTTAGLTYDSNLLGGPNNTTGRGGTDDIFATLAPQLDFVRKAGLIQLRSGAGVNISRYFDQTNLNAEDFNANIGLSSAQAIGGTFTGSFLLEYRESATVAPELNTRVQSDSLTFGANGQLAIGRRWDLTGGANYANVKRSNAGNLVTVGSDWRLSLRDFLRGTALRLSYSYLKSKSDAGRYSAVGLDQSSNQFSAGLSRRLSPSSETTIYADVGYRFLHRSTAEKTIGADNNGGMTFNAGIDGPFLPRKRFPKLRSKLNLSYADSATPGVNDTGQRTLQGNVLLDWEARATTKVGVSASKARTLTINNLTTNTTSVELHASQKLRYNLSGTVATSYAWTTYPGLARNDETLSFNTALDYSFARVWTGHLRYEYREVASDRAGADFNHHVVNVNVSCRY